MHSEKIHNYYIISRIGASIYWVPSVCQALFLVLYIPYFIEFLQPCKISIISPTLQMRKLKLNKKLSNHPQVMQLKKSKSSKSSLSDSRPVPSITSPMDPSQLYHTATWQMSTTWKDRRLEFGAISLTLIFMRSEWNIHALLPPLTLFLLWGFLLRGLDSRNNCHIVNK